MIILFLSVFFFLLSAIGSTLYANNVAVANVTITGQSTSAETCKVQFDISWDNSWRNSVNYDAVWVFIKYSTDSGSTWAHATLKTSGTNPAGFSQGTGTGLDLVVPSDKKGAFLQRTSNSSGSVDTDDIQFVWDWGTDGLSASDTARVKLFAFEMVYIPEGAFYAGSGGAGANEFTSTQITTADASASGGYPTGQTPPNASWPNGYSAFYLTKYELSQGIYVDFFNTLTSDQKTERDLTGNHATYGGKNSDDAASRNTISWTSGDASAGTNQYVACNYIAWADLIAFADWAGLRPMTELEFEKAGRGTASVVADEYAWGSTTIKDSTTSGESLTDEGLINETGSDTGNGLCNYDSDTSDDPDGPMRAGFAATSSTTRSRAGAGYYGNMELSGNLWERCVTISHATGRAFTGLHGNGALDSSGDADVANWPSTGATGSGSRGGSWQDAATRVRTSDRDSASSVSADRGNTYGARCARTAP